MLGWIVRVLLVLAGLIASIFVTRDALNFDIVQMIVAVLLFTTIIAIAAFWPIASRKKTANLEPSVSVVDAIYHRRAVRDYLPQKIDKDLIRSLLDAAVHAPTAMHEEPWSFVIIQDKSILDRLSDTAKHLVLSEAKNSNTEQSKHILDLVNKPDFHVFYNAGTLIVIYSKFQGPFVLADCWLAAENLMLTACAKGLGTCVIGFAVSALNTPEWKIELGVPAEMTAIVPIIVGLPAGVTPPVSRKQPEILVWK